jgi:hypothetical protein
MKSLALESFGGPKRFPQEVKTNASHKTSSDHCPDGAFRRRLSDGHNSHEMVTLGEAAVRGDSTYRQYRTADYVTAKTALLEYIAFLDKAATSDPDQSGTYDSDVMVSNVRLAKLEEKNSGPDKERYMTAASARCGKLKIKRDCSPESLRRSVDQIDTVPPK